MTRRFRISGAAVLLFPALLFAAEPGSPDLRTAAIVDLTHPFDEKTLYWPTSPSGFELKRLAYGETSGGWFYSSYSFCAPEHG
nr:cyclase family protein [Acidobacteriota bacterium]